ncbi:putative plant PDR ABC transporter associated [Helianthus annuus]|nr:putative plant PDR ABC transporter associated [Helianthus annuus]
MSEKCDIQVPTSKDMQIETFSSTVFLAYLVIFTIFFILAFTYLNPCESSRTMVPNEDEQLKHPGLAVQKWQLKGKIWCFHFSPNITCI